MKILMFVSLLVCLTGCVPGPRVLVHPFEQPQRSVPAQEVEFIVDSDEIQRPYRVVAHLSVTGAERFYRTERDREEIEEALRSKAAEWGADAVVVTSDYGAWGNAAASNAMPDVETGREAVGALALGVFSSRIHTIKAVAIVYQPTRSR